MTGAALVVALANARAATRPAFARHPVPNDALADAVSASELLEPFLGASVTARDLPGIRALASAVVVIVDALVDGDQLPLEPLNALAAAATVTMSIDQAADRTLRTTMSAQRPSAAATLLVRAMEELDAIEPSRLRRCARPECRLVFYDVTRSSTQRWHAERPCGLRERQRRHQAKHSA